MAKVTEPSTPGDVSSTRTVDRALALLMTLLEGTTNGTLSDLARATGLSPSTASRLLSTLAQHQLIRRDSDGRHWAGSRMKQIAAATLREEPLYELVGPHLHALVEETGETASLGVAAGKDQVLYLRQVASTRQVQTITWTGRTIPRKDTALGAALDGKPTPRGYVTSQRPDSDVTAVAAPIIGHDGTILGAISINAPTYRTSEPDVERFGQALVRHASTLSSSLGAPAHLVGTR
ncbi:IclR family transcriptional regulator [Dactylosporangium sucinum]|uniref:IclR family transcriptional regulator n=1 Tax=Dactylosporangium sucinum TaxID=1424081 RepID=UPI00167D2AF8|nr:IclR family transcriptional regulator [Dactylosporangium sucinum]